VAAPARAAPAPVAAAEQVVAEPGQSLDGDVRRRLESDLGADFSDVRVHADEQANAAAAGLDAAAFTVGPHVVFGAGAYRPDTPAGEELVRHEAAHVLQQRAGGGADTGPLEVGAVDTQAERAAAGGAAPGVIAVNSRVIQRVPRGQAPAHFITDVFVNQAGQSQTVRWQWSDTGMDPRTAPCSAGKGHCCCEDPGVPACSEADTRIKDSNLTPVGDFRVVRPAHSNHPPWWTEFVPNRAIALHQYTPVDGSPLSHGCVRMNDADAHAIFDGARPGRTTVHVTGVPTPLCAKASLQREWSGDFNTAGTEPRDGEERTALRSAYGVDDAGLTTELAAAGSPATPASVAARIPRCLPGPGKEERDLAAAPAGTVPATAGLGGFTQRLRQAGSMREAEAATRLFGQSLWQSARARAQRARNPDLDDRPLYWARLRAQSAIRAWQPGWRGANPDVRRRAIPALLQILEQTSRGFDEFSFPAARPGGRGAAAPGTKRIVISGFDPFDGDMGSLDQANPSASAALALDGMPVTAPSSSGTGTVRGRVEAVVFPVRYRDFDAGIVENAMRPHIVGPPTADLVMTISRGGSQFELEEQAGGRRGSRSADNAGGVGNTVPVPPAANPHATPPVPPPRPADVAAAAAGPQIPGGGPTDPEFIRTNVSPTTLAGMRSGIPRTGALHAETDIVDVNPATGVQSGPTPTHTPGNLAVEGSGSNFLSNEIVYRTSRLRVSTNSTVPVIHLHVPRLAGVDPPAERRAIVETVRRIIAGALPTL
jgi:hypothetical protein